MKSDKKIFIIFISVFAFFALAFTAKIYWDINRQPKAVLNSTIPSLSLDKLNNIVKKLEGRSRVSSGEKADFSGVQFGNPEPFAQ